MKWQELTPAHIARLLPYGDEFRFVQSIRACAPDFSTISTAMHYDADNVILHAHFRDGPAIVPGVILAEQAFQSALLLLRLKGYLDELPLLGRMQCTWNNVVPANTEVVAEVETEFLRDGYAAFRSVLIAEGAQVGRITFTAKVGRLA